MKKFKKKQVLEKIKEIGLDMGEDLTTNQQKEVLKDFSKFFLSSKEEEQHAFMNKIISYMLEKDRTISTSEESLCEFLGLTSYFTARAISRGNEVKLKDGHVNINGLMLNIDVNSLGQTYLGNRKLERLDMLDWKFDEQVELFGEDKEELPNIDGQYEL